MPTITIVETMKHLIAFGKDGLGNIQILHIIYLIPFFITYIQRLQVGVVKQGDDTQHLLIVFVVAQGMAVGIKERHVFLLSELLGELIDVDRLVILIDILITESFLWHKVHDVAFVVYPHHRAVHPRLIFGHQCQIGVRISKNHLEEAVAENQVTLDEQRIVLLQPFLH